MFYFDGWWRPIQWEFRDALYLILKVYSKPLKLDTARICTPTGLASNIHFKKAVLQLKHLEKGLLYRYTCPSVYTLSILDLPSR